VRAWIAALRRFGDIPNRLEDINAAAGVTEARTPEEIQAIVNRVCGLIIAALKAEEEEPAQADGEDDDDAAESSTVLLSFLLMLLHWIFDCSAGLHFSPTSSQARRCACSPCPSIRWTSTAACATWSCSLRSFDQ
jgi:hypothetical protein